MEQPPDDEAVASARQHDQVTDLIPPMVEAQYAALDAWLTGKKKKEQAERSASWRAHVKRPGNAAPKRSTSGSASGSEATPLSGI
eukprot:6473348-Amphidinium_carterae.2